MVFILGLPLLCEDFLIDLELVPQKDVDFFDFDRIASMSFRSFDVLFFHNVMSSRDEGVDVSNVDWREGGGECSFGRDLGIYRPLTTLLDREEERG